MPPSLSSIIDPSAAPTPVSCLSVYHQHFLEISGTNQPAPHTRDPLPSTSSNDIYRLKCTLYSSLSVAQSGHDAQPKDSKNVYEIFQRTTPPNTLFSAWPYIMEPRSPPDVARSNDNFPHYKSIHRLDLTPLPLFLVTFSDFLFPLIHLSLSVVFFYIHLFPYTHIHIHTYLLHRHTRIYI